jgi:glutaredoxin 2
MDTQTAMDTFRKVQRYYKSILYPKYKNVNLEELKNNYDALIEIKGLFYKNVSFIKS